MHRSLRIGSTIAPLARGGKNRRAPIFFAGVGNIVRRTECSFNRGSSLMQFFFRVPFISGAKNFRSENVFRGIWGDICQNAQSAHPCQHINRCSHTLWVVNECTADQLILFAYWPQNRWFLISRRSRTLYRFYNYVLHKNDHYRTVVLCEFFIQTNSEQLLLQQVIQ